MIIGIGSDLIDIRRVEKVIERHGERFLGRIFTEQERARAERRAPTRRNYVATYAKRFAAKEACSKALGTGIRQGVWWRDMGVVNLKGGKPSMALTGGALERLNKSDACRPRCPDRPVNYRRLAAGAGFRHNFGGGCRQGLTVGRPCLTAANQI